MSEIKPLVASDTGGGDFELPSPEPSLAVCYQVVDLGTSDNGFGNLSRKVRIGWELVDQKMKDERPFVIGKFYTLSLHEKSNLRKDLVAWRNKEFTKDELAGFALKNLLGAWCTLGIAHVEKNDKTRAQITSIAGISKREKEAVKEIKPYNEPVYFDFAEYDQDAFNKIPEWIQKYILESVEWKHIQIGERVNGQDGEGPDSSEEINAEDLPF